MGCGAPERQEAEATFSGFWKVEAKHGAARGTPCGLQICKEVGRSSACGGLKMAEKRTKKTKTEKATRFGFFMACRSNKTLSTCSICSLYSILQHLQPLQLSARSFRYCHSQCLRSSECSECCSSQHTSARGGCYCDKPWRNLTATYVCKL